MATAPSSVPDHVPPELVFDIGARPGDPQYLKDPFTLWKKLDAAPDLFYAPGSPDENLPGHWVVRTGAYVRDVLQNPDPFSSSMAAGGGQSAWPRRLIPLERVLGPEPRR